ncbi:unnamed protein product [Ectocarpus sp. CCAP 1310/34]|nr:unnamed protein product [Ectocarpus sp. CCAP 1310/34]
MIAGDQVWRKFLKWPEYLGLQAELLREDSSFTDPGRTVFLSTQCGCLGGWARGELLRSFFTSIAASILL